MVIGKEKAGTSVVRINSKCRRSLTSTEKKSKEKQQKIMLLQFGKSKEKKPSVLDTKSIHSQISIINTINQYQQNH